MNEYELGRLQEALDILKKYDKQARDKGTDPNNLCSWKFVCQRESYHNDDYEEWKCAFCGTIETFNSTYTPRYEKPICVKAIYKERERLGLDEWKRKFEFL